MKSAITYLPARFRAIRDKKQIEHVHSVSLKLKVLRSKRVAQYFHAKAGKRALVSVLGNAVSPILHSLRQVGTDIRKKMATLFAYPLKWTQKLLRLISKKRAPTTLQKQQERPCELLAESKESDCRQQRRRMYKSVTRGLVRLGRSAIALAQKQRRTEYAAYLAQETVKIIMKAGAEKIAATRKHERVANHAIVLQRLWRRKKNTEQVVSILRARLATYFKKLQLDSAYAIRQKRLAMLNEISVGITNFCIYHALQRLAARLIQRVWRGYCTRKQLHRSLTLKTWKQKKANRLRQTERLRGARDALLKPSERDRMRRVQLERRVQARSKEFSPKRDLYSQRHGERAHFLQPLPVQSRPRTSVQRVPFSRFEKIVAQGAHVNLGNVLVAIPVGHEEVSGQVRPGRLSPLLVGKGCRQLKGTIHTTYDWVPARLLQREDERKTNELRCRHRCQRGSMNTFNHDIKD
ncbi:IQ motif, EF-hand binding site [Plasmopara halstedii]|uniref:IQ motif, EF-hand binding site n=1 Tax=Plasmopara halstedii TaxID=4781 RepID=A0A0N7L708_PLAHL|nr:IQ motif, EF-hand binding site [Plasmopara halstedii]CEG45755.1 IQ motif, EF-hand binding site [Plasmopara halstedii]|eukprot:XP_024582124.1 IQ motif, EF-hand binding site [Plasmopara halstedii]